MGKKLKFIIFVLAILISTSLVFAANLTSIGHNNGNGDKSNLRPVNWIETDSGLPQGLGVGQISIAMNDQTALWAIAIDYQGGIADSFTRSTDGGVNWTAGTFNAGTGLSQLFAVDDLTCWAVFNTGADQGLYKTTDGGANWINMNAGYGAFSFANVIHFFNDNDGFAQGDPVDGYHELYTTTDGGNNWNRVPQGDIPAPTTSEWGITGNYYAVGDNIWWGTNQGRIFYSSDKGYTWNVTLTPFGATNAVSCIFSDELNGFAFRSYLHIGIEPEIDITTDGGQTYTPLFVTGDMYARWFSYVPGTTSTFVGSSSEFGFEGASYSEDGGNTWITLNSGVPIQATAFLDTETGWAGNWAGAASGGMYIFDGNLHVIAGEIEGSVTDIDEGFAIEGAVVTVGTFTTTTDASGEYSMIMDVGSFTLTCEIDGYEVYTQDDILIEEDQTTTVDLQMQNLNPPINVAVNDETGTISWFPPFMIVIEDNFDSYIPGDYIAVVGDDWTTWSSIHGGPEDALVTDSQACSQSNSIRILENQDILLIMEDYTAGGVMIELKMYVPTGYCGYYNLQQTTTPGEYWGFQIYFHTDGTVSADCGGEAALVFNYDHDEWMDCRVLVDLDNDMAYYYHNDELMIEWQWSLGTFGNNQINQLGGVNIFGGPDSSMPSDIPMFFVDDVVVHEISDEVTDYNLYLDGIFVNAVGSNILEYTYTSLVDGQTYAAGVSAVYDGDESDIVEVFFTYFYNDSFDPPNNPMAVVDDYNDIVLTWELPGGAVDGIAHHTGYGDNGVGSDAVDDFICAARFDAVELADYYGGWEITGVNITLNSLDFDYLAIQVYEGGSLGDPGTLVYDEEITTSAVIGEVTPHLLTSPVALVAGNEYWLAYDMHATDDHPLGVDNGPMVPEKGSWIYFNSAWQTLPELSAILDYNWCITGIVSESDVIASKGDKRSEVIGRTHGIRSRATLEAEYTRNIDRAVTPLRNSRSLAGYKIYRNGTMIVDISNPTILTFTDESLDAGTYEYELLAYYTDPDGESVLTDPVEATVVLDCPSNIEVQSMPPNIIVLWNVPARGVESYNIYRDGSLIQEGITGVMFIDISIPAGIYLYSVTAVYDGGWESYPCDEVEVFHLVDPLVADFEAIPTEGLLPLDVQFTDLSTGGLPVTFRESNDSKIIEKDNSRDIVSWDWDFNSDGTIDSNEQNPLFTYTEVGLYTVSLTVSDGTTTDTETKVNYITVGELLVADFEAIPTEGLLPLSVQFTDLSSVRFPALSRESDNSITLENENSRDIVSWEWDFNNDGTIDSYEQNPSYNYTEAGLYAVSLTVSDGINDDTETKVDYITVCEPIIAEFVADPLTGLVPLNVQFTDLSSGGLDIIHDFEKNTNTPYKVINKDHSREIISWEWDFNNDGTIDSYEQNPAHTYTVEGAYTVVLTVSDGTNTNTEAKVNYINAIEPLTADFTGTPLTGDNPLDVQFTDMSSNNPTSWLWDFDNNGFIDSNEQNPSYIYMQEGTYTVSLTILNGAYEDTETKVDYITVNSINSVYDLLPVKTALYSNHPNPFNPITTIMFDIKENETGLLSIYNIKGQIMESQQFESGKHSFIWNASNQSSGIYFYKLQTQTITETSKMILLK